MTKPRLYCGTYYTEQEVDYIDPDLMAPGIIRMNFRVHYIHNPFMRTHHMVFVNVHDRWEALGQYNTVYDGVRRRIEEELHLRMQFHERNRNVRCVS